MFGRKPDEKVPRQTDADKGKAETAAGFHEHNGKRDGDAGAAVEDVVQEAVARIVVALPVAAKAERLKKVAAQRCEERRRVAGVSGAPGCLPADFIQLGEVGRRVERGILRAGDEERRLVERDLLFGASEQTRKSLQCHGIPRLASLARDDAAYSVARHPCAWVSSQRSASMAALQPAPAAVTAWR